MARDDVKLAVLITTFVAVSILALPWVLGAAMHYTDWVRTFFSK